MFTKLFKREKYKNIPIISYYQLLLIKNYLYEYEPNQIVKKFLCYIYVRWVLKKNVIIRIRHG
jgi:hypothetical protein